jgi:hypothetical protein
MADAVAPICALSLSLLRYGDIFQLNGSAKCNNKVFFLVRKVRGQKKQLVLNMQNKRVFMPKGKKRALDVLVTRNKGHKGR